jgi:hypothetical protein
VAKKRNLETKNLLFNIKMKDSLIKQCLDILKTEDVRNEIKILFSPVTDLILYEIYPYIYVIIFLVFLIFILILANLLILVTLLRNKNVINTFH